MTLPNFLMGRSRESWVNFVLCKTSRQFSLWGSTSLPCRGCYSAWNGKKCDVLLNSLGCLM